MRRSLIITGFFLILVVIFLLFSNIVSLLYQLLGGYTLANLEGSVLNNNELTSNCFGDDFVNYQTNDEIMTAKRYYEAALEFDDSSGHSHLQLGNIYCSEGNPMAAIEHFNRFIELRPNNPLGYLGKGFAYEASLIMCERTIDCHLSEKYRNEMISAWKQASVRSEDFYKNGDELRKALDFSSANEWYQRGLNLNSDHMTDLIEREGEVTIIEDFATLTFWKPCDWCENVQGEFGITDGILTMTYMNNMDKRDKFGYRMLQKIPLEENKNIILRVKGEPGTLLTLEAVIDKERERYINYRSIQSEWEILSLSIAGEVLSEITLFISEPESLQDEERYKIHVDWIGISP